VSDEVTTIVSDSVIVFGRCGRWRIERWVV